LEQRSCSGNYPYYLLGGKGLLKIQKRPSEQIWSIIKKNCTPCYYFYLNHDACVNKLLFH
jgi:hypothetical protein